MVRGKIRLTLTVLIVLAVCAGMIVCTASASTGFGMGKGISGIGKVGKTTTAVGKTSISASPFGTTGFSNSLSKSDGTKAFGNTQFMTNNLIGARLTTDAVSRADQFGKFGFNGFNGVNDFNCLGFGKKSFGTTAVGTNDVIASPFGTFITENAKSKTDGVKAKGFNQVSSTQQGVSVTSDSISTEFVSPFRSPFITTVF